ncbi:MAG: hypothetical protein QUU85_09050, partial [Candidatus Eisenbacteria bacterium]|nr:hypothetical protein [Candidatus Eisenbacteria bacterium]
MDDPAFEDLGAQTAPMDEASQDLFAGHAGEMGARLAEADPAGSDRSDPELAPHQVIERDAARHEIPAAFAGAEREAVVACKRLDRLGLCLL